MLCPYCTPMHPCQRCIDRVSQQALQAKSADPHIMETIAKTHNMEKVQLRMRIAELEDCLLRAATTLDLVYGDMPKDRAPGPPTSIVAEMRRIAKAVEVV
jgi:hypothetical protein